MHAGFKHPLIKFLYALSFAALLVLIPLTAQAAAVDIPCRPSTTGTADLFNCINQLYKYALVICSIAAIIMIMIGGYMYIFSGGSEKKVGTAKSFISSSLIGIAVLLVGFVLLRQINPSLLTIKNISPNPVPFKTWLVNEQIITTNTPPTGGVLVQNGNDIKDCPTGIKAIPVDIAGRTGESGCQTLIDALTRIKTEAGKLGVDFIVTDAYGQGHQSIFHRISGTCADLVPKTNNPDSWNKLCKAVNATGNFRILNEYKDASAPECGKYTKTRLATGNHIHIVLQNTLDDLEDVDTAANGSAGWPTGQVKGKSGKVCNGGSVTGKATEATKCLYASEIKAAAAATGVDEATIRTVIHIESSYNPSAGSSAGATGLMQMTQVAADAIRDKAPVCANGQWKSDPAANILCGAYYLRYLLNRNAGKLQSAIAAYNGGINQSSRDCPGLTQWQCAFDNPEQTVCNEGNGSFLETRNYVLNFQAVLPKYQNACK